MSVYNTPAEIEHLVRTFEECTLPHEQWTHHAHLTVALWYLRRLPVEQATDSLRSGIKTLNKSHGVADTPTGGYHETITLFYIHQVCAYLDRSGQDVSLVELTNGLLAEWGDKARIANTIRAACCCPRWPAPAGWSRTEGRFDSECWVKEVSHGDSDAGTRRNSHLRPVYGGAASRRTVRHYQRSENIYAGGDVSTPADF